jgi:hypothetical protein
MTLANPWVAIPDHRDYVLAEDKAYIDAHNSRHERGADSWINLAYTPEPRLGPIDAPVYILQANPSYERSQLDGNPNQQEVLKELQSIRQQDAAHLGAFDKGIWWDQTLKQLKRRTGAEQLARGICSVEFFPYRSMRFAHGHIRLPSQNYTFELVAKALQAKKIIILTRSAQIWFGAVPALATEIGKSVFLGSNAQRTFITPGNLSPPVFDRIVSVIKSANPESGIQHDGM